MLVERVGEIRLHIFVFFLVPVSAEITRTGAVKTCWIIDYVESRSCHDSSLDIDGYYIQDW